VRRFGGRVRIFDLAGDDASRIARIGPPHGGGQHPCQHLALKSRPARGVLRYAGRGGRRRGNGEPRTRSDCRVPMIAVAWRRAPWRPATTGADLLSTGQAGGR